MLQSLFHSISERPALWAKIIAAVLSVAALLIFDESQIRTAEDYVFVFVIGVESTIFINSISPYALMSIFLAKSLLSQGKYSIIAAGFLSAFAANLLSFYIGSLFRKRKQEGSSTKFLPLMLTFWHPQFASIEAFECGVKGKSFTTYILKALPVAAAYYFLACLLIATVPLDFSYNVVIAISLVLLVGWIIWEWFSAK